MKRLNLNKLRSEKNFVSKSSKDALSDITLINWSKEVLGGDKKIEVKSARS